MKKLTLFAIGFLLSMTLTTGAVQAAQYTLTDSVGYVWALDQIDTNPGGLYFAGTVTMTNGEVRDAVAMYLNAGGDVSLSGAAGLGVPFNYLIKWGLGGGSGNWINVTAGAGHGTITVTQGLSAAPNATGDGPLPGVE